MSDRKSKKSVKNSEWAKGRKILWLDSVITGPTTTANVGIVACKP